ncbi:MAG: hypothetical protein FJY85_15705 [Deltaproteobacteria bacterium]|nr:hypothetical protein [Deltaproteobacteria bacterium]
MNCASDPSSHITLEYVLGYVHSVVFHFLYSQYFGALRMAGGDFQFQAPQLRVIPIRVPSEHIKTSVTTHVRKVRELLMNGETLENPVVKRLVDQINKDIMSSYDLTSFQASKLLEFGLS